ncbi:MAG: hypothetical protein U0527_02605 [Candidatus Eisenbacteria bacterium]
MAGARRRIFLLVDHPRWALASIAARLAAWLPRWDLGVACGAADVGEFDLVHLLYPPLGTERARIPEGTPLLLLPQRAALAALPAIARAPAPRSITVGGVPRAIVRIRTRGEAHFFPMASSSTTGPFARTPSLAHFASGWSGS